MIRFIIFIFLFLLIAKVIEMLLKFIRIYFVGESENEIVKTKKKKTKYRAIEDAKFEDITDKNEKN